MIENSALVEMKVYHKRHKPKQYEFSHKVLYLLLKLGKSTSTIKSKFFSINKFNIFSLFWRDYGFKKFNDPEEYIKKILRDFNIQSDKIESIFLLTIPKIFGCGFNPVSFWLCFDANKLLRSVLAEVNNTFGERHGYLCFNKDIEPISKFNTIDHPKVFHVSPFCTVTGHYEFLFDISAKSIQINIDYYNNDKKLISTSIKGINIEISDKNFAKYLFLAPFMTIKVLLLIHYHAGLLWLKKIPYIKKPPKLDIDIT